MNIKLCVILLSSFALKFKIIIFFIKHIFVQDQHFGNIYTIILLFTAWSGKNYSRDIYNSPKIYSKKYF